MARQMLDNNAVNMILGLDPKNFNDGMQLAASSYDKFTKLLIADTDRLQGKADRLLSTLGKTATSGATAALKKYEGARTTLRVAALAPGAVGSQAVLGARGDVERAHAELTRLASKADPKELKAMLPLLKEASKTLQGIDGTADKLTTKLGGASFKKLGVLGSILVGSGVDPMRYLATSKAFKEIGRGLEAVFGHLAGTNLQSATMTAQQTGVYGYGNLARVSGFNGLGVSPTASFAGAQTASAYGFTNQQAFGRVGAGISAFSQAGGVNKGTAAGLYQALMSTGRSEADVSRMLANFNRTNQSLGVNGDVAANVALNAIQASPGVLAPGSNAPISIAKLSSALIAAIGNPQGANEILTLLGTAAGPQTMPGWGEAVSRLTMLGVSLRDIEQMKAGDPSGVIAAFRRLSTRVHAGGNRNASQQIGLLASNAGLSFSAVAGITDVGKMQQLGGMDLSERVKGTADGLEDLNNSAASTVNAFKQMSTWLDKTMVRLDAWSGGWGTALSQIINEKSTQTALAAGHVLGSAYQGLRGTSIGRGLASTKFGGMVSGVFDAGLAADATPVYVVNMPGGGLSGLSKGAAGAAAGLGMRGMLGTAATGIGALLTSEVWVPILAAAAAAALVYAGAQYYTSGNTATSSSKPPWREATGADADQAKINHTLSRIERNTRSDALAEHIVRNGQLPSIPVRAF